MASSALFYLSLVFSLVAISAQCSTDLECSLNGVCTAAACVCDKPWSGPSCSTLAFAVTPASAKNIYNASDPRNTWGGPVVGPGADGRYHAFIPLYEAGSLWKVETTLHGLADAPTGPWDFVSLPNIASTKINPSFVSYRNATGATVYALLAQSEMFLADSLYGPFTMHPFNIGTNPAPVLHNGVFFATTQKTLVVVTAPSLAGPWTNYSNITAAHPGYRVEDPFLWLDKRGRWHILNHAMNNTADFTHCGSSHVSAHFFSLDGKDWHVSAQPYGHTVTYDDGTSHTFATLERPNLHFKLTGIP